MIKLSGSMLTGKGTAGGTVAWSSWSSFNLHRMFIIINEVMAEHGEFENTGCRIA